MAFERLNAEIFETVRRFSNYVASITVDSTDLVPSLALLSIFFFI